MVLNIKEVDGVAIAEINRPEKRNALNSQVVLELKNYFIKLSSDSNIKALLIRGAGSEAYCAGADLGEMKEVSKRSEVFRGIAEMLNSLIQVPVPVISAIRGYTMAGGLGLVACSDVVFAAEDSVIALPELKIGVVPAMVMGCLSSVVNQKILADMVLTGRKISASEAVDLGLVSRVFKAKDFDSSVEKELAKIKKCSRESLVMSRELFQSINNTPSRAELRTLADKVSLLSEGEYVSRKIKEFLKL